MQGAAVAQSVWSARRLQRAHVGCKLPYLLHLPQLVDGILASDISQQLLGVTAIGDGRRCTTCEGGHGHLGPSAVPATARGRARGRLFARNGVGASPEWGCCATGATHRSPAGLRAACARASPTNTRAGRAAGAWAEWRSAGVPTDAVMMMSRTLGWCAGGHVTARSRPPPGKQQRLVPTRRRPDRVRDPRDGRACEEPPFPAPPRGGPNGQLLFLPGARGRRTPVPRYHVLAADRRESDTVVESDRIQGRIRTNRSALEPGCSKQANELTRQGTLVVKISSSFTLPG
eukprot:scaffold1135_cov343-Prasinococcus_capsulatus_cf.AAC.15